MTTDALSARTRATTALGARRKLNILIRRGASVARKLWESVKSAPRLIPPQNHGVQFVKRISLKWAACALTAPILFLRVLNAARVKQLNALNATRAVS